MPASMVIVDLTKVLPLTCVLLHNVGFSFSRACAYRYENSTSCKTRVLAVRRIRQRHRTCQAQRAASLLSRACEYCSIKSVSWSIKAPATKVMSAVPFTSSTKCARRAALGSVASRVRVRTAVKTLRLAVPEHPPVGAPGSELAASPSAGLPAPPGRICGIRQRRFFLARAYCSRKSSYCRGCVTFDEVKAP